MNPIYVKESDIPTTKNRKEFLRKLITNKGFITYSDKDCTTIQCDRKSAFRSVTELHMIVKSRFKITSLKAVVKIIKELIDEEKKISMVWCTQINKVVIKYLSSVPDSYITPYSKSNYFKSKGVDGYSLEDYENIINEL